MWKPELYTRPGEGEKYKQKCISFAILSKISPWGSCLPKLQWICSGLWSGEVIFKQGSSLWNVARQWWAPYSPLNIPLGPPHRSRDWVSRAGIGCLPLSNLLNVNFAPRCLAHWPQGKSFFRSPWQWFIPRMCSKTPGKPTYCLLPEFLTNKQPKSKRNSTEYSERARVFHLLEPRPLQFTDILNDSFLLHRHFG